MSRATLEKLLNRTSFRRQLSWTFVVGIVLVYLSSSIAVSYWAVHAVRNSMIEEGVLATETIAGQSVLALLYGSPENARDSARATLGFPDVEAVAIYNEDGSALLELGDLSISDGLGKARPDGAQLVREDDKAFYFVAPVRYGRVADSVDALMMGPASPPEQVIGYVQLGVGKTRLNELTRSVFGFNFLQSIVLAGLLLTVLLALTRRVTNPIHRLSEIMNRAKQGETGLRAEESGPKDVLDMQAAFNTMMGVIENRNQALSEARDAALEVARIKGEFAANVSHELRTPLNGVLGMLELLRVSNTLTPTDRGYIDVAFNSGSALLELINDILDFSKIETGQLRLHIEDFFLPAVLGEIVGLVAGQAQRKNLDIVYHIAPEVPTELRGDITRIRQVLVNLIGNAIKFTDEGSVVVRVKYDGRINGGSRLRFEVADTGIGIPEQAHRRIFEAFQQADGSTTRRYGGTGLGLAICRQLVTLMGGDIGVESEPGKGSRFWFSMPLAAATDVSVKPDRSVAAGLRILGVIASDDQQAFFDQIARSWDAYYRGVVEVQRALAVLEEAHAGGRPFDVVVVDDAFGPGHTDALIAALVDRARYGSPCLVLITGTSYGEAERRSGVDGCLAKPLHEAQLYESVVGALQGRAGRRAVAAQEGGRDVPENLGGSILVVEDDRGNQFVVKAMLERLGCTVEIARNGVEALEKTERSVFDLILMDCQMPQMDGYEATRRIRQHEGSERRTPIIAMTAHAQARDEDKCRAAGMDDYLTKPLRLQVLAAMLGRWLGIEIGDKPAASAVAIHEVQGIDFQVFGELREQLGPHFERYIDLYLEDVSAYVATLKESVKRKDATAIAAAAHTIKGSSGTLGAFQIADLAASIEDAARVEKIEGLEERIDKLEGEIQSVARFVSEGGAIPASTAMHGEALVGTVLVVDDDRGTRLALRKILEADGYSVVEAGDGAEAVHYCERQCPDLVLLDAIMPSMNGFEACQRIRALPNSGTVPILMITALDDQESIERTITAGATDYIPKPINFRLLRKRVGRVLSASRVEQDRWRLVYTDDLTNLPNRVMFREQLAKLLSRPREANDGLAVLFLDLDRFKLANDTLGHDIGDLLIKAVAERISRCVRSSDVVARLGGDEFGVILDKIDGRDPAARVARNLVESLAVPFTFLEKDVFLGASIGIAMYPDDGRELGALIKCADTAMFRSKEERGGQYSFYDADMAAAVETRVDIERELRKAVERDQFVLYYQPQIDIATGEIVAVEALIRWDHPERGLIPPLDFIPVAEDTGLILPIGEWVLVEACTRIEKIRRQLGSNLRVAVNICGKQLTHPNFVEQLRLALRSSGLPAHALELEITETSLIECHGEMQPRVAEIKSVGVTLSVDDFGTGYSSLSYLTRLPVDLVKIDRAFIRGLPGDLGNANIVKAVVAMASSLNMNVLAEGVETPEQVEVLSAMGCELMQGYYWSKPLPSDQFVEWIKKDDYPRPLGGRRSESRKREGGSGSS